MTPAERLRFLRRFVSPEDAEHLKAGADALDQLPALTARLARVEQALRDSKEALRLLLHEVDESGAAGDDFGWPHALKRVRAALTNEEHRG